jgi:hypothetical protein
MRKVLIVFVLLSVSNFPQSLSEHIAIVVPQGYGIKLLNSAGTSSIHNDISNIGFMNPASIINFPGYSAGFSYQLNSKIKEAYIAGIGSSRSNNWLPQSAGIVFPITGLNIGLSFGQRYNGTLDIDPIPITTFQNPDGTGELFTVDFNTSVYSYAVTLNSAIKDFFTNNSLFSLGIRYSLNRLDHEFRAGVAGFETSDNSGSFSVGAQFKSNILSLKNFTIGLSYETSIEFHKSIEIHSANTIRLPDSNFIPVVIRMQLVDRIPDELRLDLSADINHNFSIYSNVTGVFGETHKNNLKNQLEFSASCSYTFNDLLKPSIGLYYTDKNYQEDFFDINKKNNALFLIAGLKISYSMFYADLAIADSHLLSGEFRKQTNGKLAVGIIL